MANPCRICANPAWTEKANNWVKEGVSDREVARRLGCDKSLVTRQRQNHFIKPLQDQLAIAAKGAAPEKQRQELAEAAAVDSPTPAQFVEAHFGLRAQAEKLQRIEERLRRMVAVAKESKSPLCVTQVVTMHFPG